MSRAYRPAEYHEYLDAASSILARECGDAALASFGLDDLFGAAEPADLTPVYAFLEAQGARVASTPALARLAAIGLPLGDGTLLGQPVGALPYVAVPGMMPGAAVAVDRPSVGLVRASGDRVWPRKSAEPVADDYVAVVELDPSATTVVVPDEEMAGLRPAMLARVRLGAAAELLGMCGRMIDDTIGYARLRRQFGRPLSSFQAMQHLLAWAATERHQLLSMYDIAVRQNARQGPDPLLNTAVKALAGRVVHTLVQTATQVTGAISFTWEYPMRPMHHRALALDQLAGSSADLIAEMGRQMRTDGTLPELFGLESAAGDPAPPRVA